MLTIRVHNDDTGTEESANYNVRVSVNGKPIWQGRVTGHDRKEGWPELLRQIATAAEESKRRRLSTGDRIGD